MGGREDGDVADEVGCPLYVNADAYLDLRRSAWSRAERQGLIRFMRAPDRTPLVAIDETVNPVIRSMCQSFGLDEVSRERRRCGSVPNEPSKRP